MLSAPQTRSFFVQSSFCLSSLKSSACKRFVSVLLCCVILAGTAVPSFAAEGETDNPDLQTLDVLSMYSMMYTHDEKTNTDTNYSDFTRSTRSTSKGELVCFKNNNPNFYRVGVQKVCQVSNYLNIKADTHYNLSFYTYTAGSYRVKVTARVFSGSAVKDIVIYDNRVKGSQNLYLNDFDLILHSSDLGSSYRIRLAFEVIGLEAANTPYLPYEISRFITLQDLDSNAGWFQKIINTIKAVPDKLKLFFTQLGDRISGFFTDLKNSVVEQFNNVKQWFNDLGNTIKQKFNELGDSIHVFFVELKNDIIEGLKKLFIPQDGYFEQKKIELENWAKEHLGAVYQGTGLIIDFFKTLLTVSPKSPAITMPAIEFEFKGVSYHLTDPIHYSFAWVNDSTHPLFYIYKIYRGFVTLLLFLTFIRYLQRKYNEIFGGGEA